MISKIAEIAEIAEIAQKRNTAANWDLNRLHPPSQSIVTCSEGQKEDGRIAVVPLGPPSLWEGTTYTVATLPLIGGERTQKNEPPPVTTRPKSIGSADSRWTKAMSSTGSHRGPQTDTRSLTCTARTPDITRTPSKRHESNGPPPGDIGVWGVIMHHDNRRQEQCGEE